MAKFYVTSGQIRECLSADDAEGAALEALDRFLQPSAWVFEDERMSDADRRAHLALESLLKLAPEFRVSQRGFAEGVPGELSDAVHFPTADLCDTHFRFAVALRRFVASFGYAPCGAGASVENAGSMALAG